MAFNPNKCLKFTALDEETTIYVGGSLHTYYFMKEGTTEWVEGEITLQQGESAYCKGTGAPCGYGFYFEGSDGGPVRVAASGNVMSLLDDGAGELTVIEDTAAFAQLFTFARLASIPEDFLPATTLSDRCYENMFGDNPELEVIPEGLLPATELKIACYYGLFYNCTNIKEIPEKLLPALVMKESCYDSIFSGCSGITEIPRNLLPATTLAKNCYMFLFSGTSITRIPKRLLPAKQLAEMCYCAMFRDCKKLEHVPSDLFNGTPAKLCFAEMFAGCSLLKGITVKFKKWVSIDGYLVTEQWLDDISDEVSTKAAKAAKAATAPTGTKRDFFGPAELDPIKDASHIGTDFEFNPIYSHGTLNTFGMRASVR